MNTRYNSRTPYSRESEKSVFFFMFTTIPFLQIFAGHSFDRIITEFLRKIKVWGRTDCKLFVNPSKFVADNTDDLAECSKKKKKYKILLTVMKN